MMPRFSRLFASGSPLRFASATVTAAMFAGLLMLPHSARAQGLLQAPSANLTTGTVPQGVAAADFARSGWVGMVVTDSTNRNMKVYLGTGPNTYGPASTYPTCGTGPHGPSAVAAVDANNDGYPDIEVACAFNNQVQVYVNDGTGHFGAAAITETVTDPVAFVLGDFVGNNTQGMVAISGTGGVTAIVSIGGTTFVKTTPLVGTLTGIVAGDFNHDGRLDIAVSDSANNNVHVLSGNGDGTFSTIGNYSTGAGTHPSGIVAADFNSDGNLDVATSNPGTNTATVLLGSPSGAMTLQAAQATGTNPIALVTTDVNSDGYPDVVAFDGLSTTTGAVAVLLGNGDGTLQVAQIANQAFLPGTFPTVADFNRDGKPDIALTQQNLTIASVLLNNTLPTQYPDGRSFAAYNPISSGMGNFADSVAVGDFNKDGKLDIAVSYLQDNNVQVLFGGGDGSFSSAGTYAVGSQPFWIASGDFNGDGYPDLVTTNTNISGTAGTVSVLLNNKNGTFANAATYTVGKQPYQVAVGDLNGDGHPDLAVTNYGANTVTILLGSANGTFTVQPTTLSTCATPYGVAIGDFKHNGFPSVAVTCYTTSQLEVFPNNGNGTFGTPYLYTVYNSFNSLAPNPASIVVGDFNRDGKLDIVTGNTTANNVSFFAGNGDNTFATSVESPSLNFPDSIVAGDFNGDGILDIAGVAPNFNAVEVTLGVGNGTFGTIQQRAAGQFTAKTQPWALAAGDFNGDGTLDIVTANTYHQVNLNSPAYQTRFLNQYPANPGGYPSIDVLMNASAAQINLTTSPASPLPFNNSGVTINANVQPAYTGGTPTGSVIFENSSGAVLGTGPYTLDAGGTASYPVGHIGSGTYLFTSLYSGDANFQPTTGSGTAFAVVVNGTPVSLTVSPSSVVYGSSFTADVTVTATAGQGCPTGSVTIYTSTGTALQTITLPPTCTGTGSTTIAATSANGLNVGSYQLYAVYNPTNGNYQQGSSADQPLTVTPEPTSTTVNCSFNFGASPCTATVTVTGGYPPNGDLVNFTGTGQAPQTLPIIANGNTSTYNFYTFIGTFTVTATFPAQGNYAASSASVGGFCLIFFCTDRRSPPVNFNAFTGAGRPFTFPTTNRTGRNAQVPFTLF